MRDAWRGIAAVLALVASGAQAVAPMPAFQGLWVVRQVAVDRNDVIGRSHGPDDASLMNSILTIGRDGSIDPTGDDCKATRWQAKPATTIARLVARNRHTSSGKSIRPTLDDYGLHTPDRIVTPFVATCAGDSGGQREAYKGGTWFVSLDGDHLLEGNGYDMVLVYERITATKPLKPSFDCATATSESTKTICGSVSLAGRDLSVALALRQARARRLDQGQAVDDLDKSQAAWAAQRDQCKADADCLTDRMNERIDYLMQH